MKTGNRLRRAAAACCLTIAVLVGWIGLRWYAPPLRLVKKGNEVTVDLQTLGEYPTTVNRVRLSDVDHSTVVWEIVTLNGDAQLRDFTLKTGENPASLDADHGTYRVVTPKGAQGFVLRGGARYRIELWGGSTVLSKRSTTFQFRG